MFFERFQLRKTRHNGAMGQITLQRERLTKQESKEPISDFDSGPDHWQSCFANDWRSRDRDRRRSKNVDFLVPC